MKIGSYCKLFRMNLLNITLAEMEELTGVKSSTLSSFENGRSTNYKYINLYYELCNEQQRELFKKHMPLGEGVE